MSFIQVLPDYIQAFAILAAGVWTYWTFFRQRSNEPATDINVDANFVGAQAGWVVVEVMANPGEQEPGETRVPRLQGQRAISDAERRARGR